MRRPFVLMVLLVAFLVACGGGSGAASGSRASGTAVASSAAGQISPAASAAPAGNGKVDCARIKVAAVQLLAIQFLAQLKDPDTVARVKAKQMGDLDLDAFLGGMHDLHALDSYASPLGDPKAAIDTYEEAGRAAQALFATDPMTQSAIDAYNAKIGTIGAFLGHQIAISGAMDAAGC